jgi:hypothetical protein
MKWLESRDRQTTQQWCKKLRSSEQDKIEGAVAEALVWDYLACRTDSVKLIDKSGAGGVDFCFTVQDTDFLIEVTNISIEAATRFSKLPDREIRSGYHSLLTRKIRSKVRNKLQQSRNAPDMPLLIAVSTLHRNASISCCTRLGVEFAMSSPPKATIDFNVKTGDATGEVYETTDLQHSVFLHRTDDVNRDVAANGHKTISGFLLAGFGVQPEHVEMLGGLNPEAVSPFDPNLLPNEPFCFIDPWPAKEAIALNWTISEEEMQAKKQRAAEKSLRESGLWDLMQSLKNNLNTNSDQ